MHQFSNGRGFEMCYNGILSTCSVLRMPLTSLDSNPHWPLVQSQCTSIHEAATSTEHQVQSLGCLVGHGGGRCTWSTPRGSGRGDQFFSFEQWPDDLDFWSRVIRDRMPRPGPNGSHSAGSGQGGLPWVSIDLKFSGVSPDRFKSLFTTFRYQLDQ